MAKKRTRKKNRKPSQPSQKRGQADRTRAKDSEPPPQGQSGVGSEFVSQFPAFLIVSVATFLVSSFLPDQLKAVIRSAAVYALGMTFQFGLVLLLTLVLAYIAGFRLRSRASRGRRAAIFVGGWLLIVSCAEAWQYLYPPRGDSPTIAFFGFLRTADDGTLREARDLDNAAAAFYDELATVASQHPCYRMGIFRVARYEVPSVYLAFKTRGTFDPFVRRYFPDAKLGMWAFVGSKGEIEEFHVVELVDDLLSDTTDLRRGADQFVAAFNRSGTTRLAAARFGAGTLAAVIGAAYGTVLQNETGERKMPLRCQVVSELALREARARLQPRSAFAVDIAAHEKYWDANMLVGQAWAAMNSGGHTLAVDLFAKAAETSPLFPYDTRESYMDALALRRPMLDAPGVREAVEKEGIALDEYYTMRERLAHVLVPTVYGPGMREPVLVALSSALRRSRERSADEVFAELMDKWPKDPVFWIHWGDWAMEELAIEARLNAGLASGDVLDARLFPRVRTVIDRYEEAERLGAPSKVVGTRLYWAYLFAMVSDPSGPGRDTWRERAEARSQGKGPVTFPDGRGQLGSPSR